MSERLTLTVRETAALLGIGESTTREAIRLGQLPSLKYGRRIVVPRAALLRLVATDSDTHHQHAAPQEKGTP